jgi:hypothetical protein
MIKVGTYNFPDQISETTVDDISITITSNDIPVSITGVQIKFSNGVTYSNPTQITITDGPNGEFLIKSHMMTWGKGTYKHKFILTLLDGRVKQYVEGNWRIL